MAGEWQERDERQRGRLTYLVVGCAWLAFALLNIFLLVPGRTGWSQAVAVAFGCTGLVWSAVYLRRARSLRG